MSSFAQAWLRRVVIAFWVVVFTVALGIVANLLTEPARKWLKEQGKGSWIVTFLAFLIDHLPAALWVAGAIVFIVLLIAAFVQEKRFRRSSILPSVAQQEVARIYQERYELPRLRESLQGVAVAWASWYTGGIVTRDSDLRGVPLQRLLLLDAGRKAQPGQHLSSFAVAYMALADLITDIRRATRVALAVGVEVRWFDGPLVNITIAEPRDDGWIQVEIAPPFAQPERRIGFRLTAKEHPRAFRALVESFEQIWDNRELTRTPKPEDYEERD